MQNTDFPSTQARIVVFDDQALYRGATVLLYGPHGALVQPSNVPTITQRAHVGIGQCATMVLGRENTLAHTIAANPGHHHLHALPGSGATTLLQAVAHGSSHLYEDGAALLAGEDEPDYAQDVIQRLFGRFFASTIPVRVSPAQAHRYLRRVRALLLLDQPLLSRRELDTLLDVLRDNSVLLASDTAHAESTAVPGLDANEAMHLFAAYAELSQTDGALPAVQQICQVLGGMPQPIRLIANLVRCGAIGLQRAADVLADMAGMFAVRAVGETPKLAVGDTLSVADAGLHQCETLAEVSPSERRTPMELACYLSLAALSADERQALATLVRLGGPDGDIAAITAGSLLPMPMAQIALARLIDLGLVQQQGERFALASPGMRPALDRLLRPGAQRSRVAAHYVTMMHMRPHDLAWQYRERTNLLGALETLLAEEAWGAAGTLARQLAPMAALHGLWGTWGTLIDTALAMARVTDNNELLGWALHERGTRAGLMGEQALGVDDLRRALQLRQGHGTPEQCATTRHNLRYFSQPDRHPLYEESCLLEV